MKIHEFSNKFSSWDQNESPSSLELRPLAPKFSDNSSSPPSSSSGLTSATLDLKGFIRPDQTGPKKFEHKRDPPQVETQPGGTRWNPTQEQIGLLDVLYKSGMRTPNTQQIEQITYQLGKYGKIEGKNVFYWFQNHKARERQKQKRNKLINLSSQSSFTTTSVSNLSVITKTRTSTSLDIRRELMVEKEDLVEENEYKRTCRSLGNINTFDKIIENVTLELFPLHPEGRL